MLSRRDILKFAGGSLTAVAGVPLLSMRSARSETFVTLPFANGERPLVQYPGKRPLIGLTARPPQLETPFSVFNENIITPNDAFFVRYHLSDIPLEIDPEAYRIEVTGAVDKPFSLSLDSLKADYEPIEMVAAHQCSGNSRGFFQPRVGGGQLGNGAMGNARWTGVPLKAVLEKAGIKQSAKQVVFGGLDGPPIPETPDFAKALDVSHALDGEVMLAYAMNGEDLPWLNGFPVRLVVPGYFGTYWVKHLSDITVVEDVFDGFWMKFAYRIPDNDCNCTEPGKAPESTIPINKFKIRSFITSVASDDTVKADAPVQLKGFAFDSGSDIKDVALSIDGGKTWTSTTLGEDLGKYSFRPWTRAITLPKGKAELLVRATSVSGETQPMEPLWNPAGYLRNVVERTTITAQ